MLRFIARHGLVRMIGGRAVPALLLWDLAMLANRTRRIPGGRSRRSARCRHGGPRRAVGGVEPADRGSFAWVSRRPSILAAAGRPPLNRLSLS